MQDPQEIRQFTKRYATLSDPPWLAIAIWVTLAPAANQFGYLSASAELVSFLIAGAVALVLSRLYRRRYGVVVQQSEEHTSELQSRLHLVCRLLLEKKKN